MADSEEGRVGRFHPKCNSRERLSEDRRVASGENLDYCVVLSNDPIPTGLQFSVKILQRNTFYVRKSD